MSWAIGLIGPSLSGILFGLSFPTYNLKFLIWISLVPLLISKSESSLLSFGRGIWAGLLANLIIFSWFWATFRAAGQPVVMTVAVWCLFSLILSLYWGIFAWGAHHLNSQGMRPWGLAALWVGLEYIRTHVLTGFPWAFIGHTQYQNIPLIQLASLTGAWGLSFIIVGVNAGISQIVIPAKAGIQALNKQSKRRFPNWISVRQRTDPPRRTFAGMTKPLINLGIMGALLAGICFWGTKRIESGKKEAWVPFKVSLLQGDIDQYQKWDDQYELEIRDRYMRLDLEAANTKPNLIIWPESSLPGWFPNERLYVDWMRNLANRTAVPNLIGAVTTHSGKDYNAAFLINSTGSIEGMYSKQHLVPFGEYIPWGNFLKSWIPYLGQLGEFSSGRGPVIFTVEGVRLAPNICYEAIFPDLIRASVRKGADMIVNMTNDGWYLHTGAPEQHYMVNIFRAVENARSVVRAANTGISAIISPWGEEELRSPLLKAGVFSGEVKILVSAPSTFYSRWGDWFAWFCLILFGVMVLYDILRPCPEKPVKKSKN